jgi:hypothetical protein
MKYSILLTLFVILGFSGCTTKEYVKVPYEVKIPQKCYVPKTKCASRDQLNDMNASSIVEEMYRCIQQYKEDAKVCQ